MSRLNPSDEIDTVAYAVSFMKAAKVLAEEDKEWEDNHSGNRRCEACGRAKRLIRVSLSCCGHQTTRRTCRNGNSFRLRSRRDLSSIIRSV
jgi:hypothetical protein